ncbi:MAG: hypothetical protein WCS77_03905 [Elusimicrobiaceae bacterium]
MNSNETNTAQVRNQLLTAAFELIADKGIEKVSMREMTFPEMNPGVLASPGNFQLTDLQLFPCWI